MNYNTLLDEIDRLYPPERIAGSRERLRRVWYGYAKPDRLPFVFVYYPADDTAPATGNTPAPTANEQTLTNQLEAIIDRACLQDDYIPSLFLGVRQGLLPTAYGAREVQIGGHTWVEPILHDAQDVYQLAQPDFARLGVAAEFLETIRYFRAATQERLPIQMPDMQGPLDLANNLWGTEGLLLAMQETPEAAHRLLQMMTDDYIRYMCLVRESAQGDWVPMHCMPVLWFPPALGAALSEDLLAVLSPRLYRVFGPPYNRQVAAAFGGIVVHSCGSIEHNLAPLATTPGLVGVNVSITETSLQSAIKAVGTQRVLLLHHAALTCNALPTLTPEAYIRTCFPTLVREHWRSIPMPIPLELSRQQTRELVPLAESLALMS
ncbi:MAG: uroporphyrinogen decarboxylase family protein [Anaerolineae bacterium]